MACRTAGQSRRSPGAAPAGAQVLVARLDVRSPRRRRRTDQGLLHLRRRRPRQDHADGLVLRGDAGATQAAHPFPRVHARRARARACLPAEAQARRDQGRRCHPAGRRRPRGRSMAPVLRRVSRHRHRRRDDPRSPVHAAVRARCGRGCDVERRAGRALPRRSQPQPVPAVHRAARGAHGCRAARGAHRFPPGEALRRRGLARARRRGRRGGARHGVGAPDRRLCGRAA